jgi:hypothetical protein
VLGIWVGLTLSSDICHQLIQVEIEVIQKDGFEFLKVDANGFVTVGPQNIM